MAKCHMDADGDPTEAAKAKPAKDDVKKNEKSMKNSHKKKSSNVANNKTQANKGVSYENGKDEIDNVSTPEKDVAKEVMVAVENILQEGTVGTEAVVPPALATSKYSADQLPSSNESSKKCYDTGLLIRMKDHPLSKEKPNIPLLESCNLIRTAPIQEQVTFNFVPRQVINDLLPNYARNAVNSKSTIQREPMINDVRKLPHRNDGRGMPQRNDNRNMPQRNDGRSMSQRNDARNMSQRNDGRGIPQRTDASNMPQCGNSGGAAPYISISLARDDVKLNQVEDAWKPTRFKMESLPEEELKTQDLYKKFRGILNKLTPQKFDTLVEKVKALEINTQARLEGVIDLVFQKAIDEPNFSEAYAAMCSKLSTIKVPSDNDPEQCVNFRVLIITRCQKQFETQTVDERVQKLEQELAECTDPAKKKELQEQLSEENRRVRMRSVGNVRFIGELYKLKMLSSKIMVYCMMTLIDKLEEEKLECLCKLLTTIGEQVEKDLKHQLDSVFKKMQDIVLWQSGSISSRIRFMMQDVMDLRRGGWVSKSVVDSKPKTMVQIQKEAEQQQRNIELLNASPIGRDDARRRSGDVRRDAFNSPGMDYQRRVPSTSYTVDTTKLRAAMQKTVSNIKLAPSSAWNHGSGGKKPVQASNNAVISLSKNMFSGLEDVTGDPPAVTDTRSEAIESARPNSANKNTSRSGSSGSPRLNDANRTTSRSGSRGSPRPNSANKTTSRSGSIEGSRPDSANKINEQASIEAPQSNSARKSTSRSESVEASRSNSVSRSTSPSESIESPQSSPSKSTDRSASIEEPRSNSVNRSTTPSTSKQELQSSPSNSTNQLASIEAPRSKSASKSIKQSGSTEAHRSKSACRSTSPSLSIEEFQTSPSKSTTQSASVEAPRSKSASKSIKQSGSTEAPRSKSACRSTSPSLSIEEFQTSSSKSTNQSATIEAPRSKSASKSIKQSGSTEAPRSKSACRSTSPSLSIEEFQTSPIKSTYQSASIEAPRSKSASKSIKHSGSTEALLSKSASRSTSPFKPIKTPQTSPSESTNQSASTEAFRSISVSKSIKDSGSKGAPCSKSTRRGSSPSVTIETPQVSASKSTKQSGSTEEPHSKSASKSTNQSASSKATRSKSASKSIKHSSVESPRSDVANKGNTHPASVEAPQLNSTSKSTNRSRSIETPQPESRVNCSGSIEISKNSGLIEAPWPNLRSSPVPQDPMNEASKMQKELRLLVAEMLINPNDEEFVCDFKHTFSAEYHAAAVAEMLDIALEKPPKDVLVIAKAMQHLVSTSTVSSEDFLTGIQETLQFAPDLYIDIPLLYEHLAKFIAPQIANEHITFAQAFGLCGNIISYNQGHLFLEAIIKGMLKSIDPPAIERKWRESGFELGQWMTDEQVSKFINSNGLEFIDFGYGIKTVHFGGMYTQSQTQNIILLGLMKYDNDDFELIKYWMQYNFERESRESWFFDALLEALCEHALFNVGGPSLSRQSLKKCAPLLYAFGGDTPEEREQRCLSGVRQLSENLQYPPSMEAEIFSYLRSKGFIPAQNVSKWKNSDTETSEGDTNSI